MTIEMSASMSNPLRPRRVTPQLVGHSRTDHHVPMVGQITAGDKDAGETTHVSPTATSLGGTRGRGAVAWVARHPLLVVAASASVVAIGHAVWIWSNRHVGAFDPDESGYLTASLRMEGLLRSLDLVAFSREVEATNNGVTVPVLSVPFTLLGPRDPRTVMMLHPVLLVFTSVATAGITRRITGPWAAVAAGLAVAALPTMSTATQSYWYGLGATACLVGAMWALVASDRGQNRWIWWFGVGVALMSLSRTMSLGYVPAAFAAGLVVVGRDRRGLLRLVGAAGVTLLVAGPWYLMNRGSIFGYLLSYGYGERAGEFGDGDVVARTAFRIERYAVAFGATNFLLLWASALCVAALCAWAHRDRLGSVAGIRSLVRAHDASWRAWLAVATCVLLGTAALVSTSNNGVWFELPMVPLLAVVLVSGISLAPRWYAAGLAAVIAPVLVWGLAVQWWLVPFEPGRATSHYEYGFAEYDDRFAPDRRDEHPNAAREWYEFYRELLSSIRPQAPGEQDPVFTLSGNMQLFNANSLTFTGELGDWSPRLEVPDTAEDFDRRSEWLTPTVEHHGVRVERQLLIAEHDQTLFTPDADVVGFARQAERSGWVEKERYEMPDGGAVVLLVHPGSLSG